MKRPVVILFIFIVLGIILYCNHFLGVLLIIFSLAFLSLNGIINYKYILLIVVFIIIGNIYISFRDYQIPYGEKADLTFDIIRKSGDYYKGSIVAPLDYKGMKLNISSDMELEEGKRYSSIGSFGKDYVQYNPNTFNFEYYNKAKESLGFFYAGKLVEEIGGVTIFQKLRIDIRNRILNISKIISEKHYGIFYCFITGDDFLVSEIDLEKYRDISIAHLMAVSGFHIALVYGFIYKFLEFIKVGKNSKKVCSLIIVFAYVMLISTGVSSLRALVFIFLSELAYFINRRRDMLTTLCFTGLVFIVFNPYVLWDIAFQLSFLAVLSIILFAPRVKKIVKWNLLAIPIAVNVLILPISTYWFGKIYVFSVMVNLLMVFLFGLFYPILLFAFFVNDFIINFLWVNKLVNFLYDLFYSLVEIFYNLSKYTIGESVKIFLLEDVYIHWSVLMGILLLLYIIVFSKEKKISIAQNIIVVFSCILLIMIIDYCSLHINYLDVGQGDCIYIRKGQYNVLIDSGYDYKKGDLEKVLLRNGIKDIDIFILSHCHRDHYGGLLNFEVIDVESIYMSNDNYDEKFDDFKDKIKFVDSLSILNFGGLELVMIPGLEVDDNINNRSMYVSIMYSDNHYLFTGDGEKELEKRNLKNHLRYISNLDVLKVPHHGSKTSSSAEFVEKSSPRYAIIQVGENRYGLPDNPVIDRYLSQGIKVYNNQRDGCVRITNFGRFYMIRTYRRR